MIPKGQVKFNDALNADIIRSDLSSSQLGTNCAVRQRITALQVLFYPNRDSSARWTELDSDRLCNLTRSPNLVFLPMNLSVVFFLLVHLGVNIFKSLSHTLGRAELPSVALPID